MYSILFSVIITQYITIDILKGIDISEIREGNPYKSNFLKGTALTYNLHNDNLLASWKC